MVKPIYNSHLLFSVAEPSQPQHSAFDVDLIIGASLDADTIINQHQKHADLISAPMTYAVLDNPTKDEPVFTSDNPPCILQAVPSLSPSVLQASVDAHLPCSIQAAPSLSQAVLMPCTSQALISGTLPVLCVPVCVAAGPVDTLFHASSESMSEPCSFANAFISDSPERTPLRQEEKD